MAPSDVVGALAAEPGAAELARIAGTVRTLDPANVRDVATRIANAGDGARTVGEEMTRQAATVQDGWQGEGAQAFGAWAGEFGRAGARAADGARQIGGVLDRVATTLEGLCSEVSTQVELGLAAAAAARQQASGSGAVLGVDQAAVAALAGPTAAARDALARAEGVLAGMAGRINEVAAGVTGFAALREVGTTQVTPTGTPQPWQPRPEAGAAPPGGGASGDGASGGAPSGGAPSDRAPAVGETSAVTGGGSGDPGGGSGGGGSRGGAEDGSGSGGGPGDGTPGDGDLVGGGGAPTPAPPGEVGDWVQEAMRILAENGTDMSKVDAADIAVIIEHESGGDPSAFNDWDANAENGVPSQGLMQTIPPTFEAHKLPGHGDITDPVDNIIAGVRYAIERYGSTAQVPGVESVTQGLQYRPY